MDRFKAVFKRAPRPVLEPPQLPVIPVEITRPPAQVPGYDENQAQTMPAPPPNREWSPPPPPMPQTVPRPQRPTWTMPAGLPPKHVPTVVPEWQPPPPPYPPPEQEEDRMEAEVQAKETQEDLAEIKASVDKIDHNQKEEDAKLDLILRIVESRTHAGPQAILKQQKFQAWPPASLRSSLGTWHQCSGR